MSVLASIRNHTGLITGIISISATGLLAAAYLGKRKLDQTCPRLPATALPKSSACRNLVENAGERISAPAWGWRTLQVELPLSHLSGYGAFRGKGDDAYPLAQNLLAAFLDNRATDPEAWFLDKDVPPLSFTPGSHLYGRKSSLGAFLLGTWSSARELFVGQPLTLPKDVPQQPVSGFPSNRDAVIRDGSSDAAGSVMYWLAPARQANALGKAASYGFPWSWWAMEGGFQEYMVERLSEKTARVTYVCLEVSNLHPRRQAARDFKTIPWLLYELHVIYAQYLLYYTLKRLKQSYGEGR